MHFDGQGKWIISRNQCHGQWSWLTMTSVCAVCQNGPLAAPGLGCMKYSWKVKVKEFILQLMVAAVYGNSTILWLRAVEVGWSVGHFVVIRKQEGKGLRKQKTYSCSKSSRFTKRSGEIFSILLLDKSL